MSRLLETTVLLLSVVLLSSARPQHTAVGKSSPATCDLCIRTADDLYNKYLNSARHLDFQEVVVNNPKSGQADWRSKSRQFLAHLVLLVSTLRSPASACEGLGYCGTADKLLNLTTSNPAALNCTLCEHLREHLEGSEAALREAALVCDSLSGELRISCKQFYEQGGLSCTPSNTCHREEPRSALQQLLSVLTDKEDQCNTCQLVIIEARSILSQPDTQKEILDYAKETCKDFGAFKEQCESYVDLYGPNIIIMAEQYLKPELCTRLGFCKKSIAADVARA